MMPTMPKLIGAIFFAALAYFTGDLIKPLLPEGTQDGLLSPTLAVIGLVMGWRISGRNAGRGLKSAFGYGLTSAGASAFWGILVFALYKMLMLSLDKRFSGPMEALKSMVGYCIEYATMIATPQILGTIIVGGLFGGWLVEWTSKRWP